MKSIFSLFAVGMLGLSCAGPDAQQPDYFNINTGSSWVYRRFQANDGIHFSPTDWIDSVRIVGDTTIQGLPYKIRRHNITPASYPYPDEYIRVDENGHLVAAGSDHAINPGTDAGYVYVRTIPTGNVTYQLQDALNVSVEGEDYFVYPYVGSYVPFNPDEESKAIHDYYAPGIGMVCQYCSNVIGPSAYEDRLISYQLN